MFGACFFSQHLSYFFYQGRFFTAFIIVDSVFLWASHTCLWDLLHQKESKAYTTHFPIQVMQIYEATQLSTFVTSFQLQSLARKGWSKSPECFWAQYYTRISIGCFRKYVALLEEEFFFNWCWFICLTQKYAFAQLRRRWNFFVAIHLNFAMTNCKWQLQ